MTVDDGEETRGVMEIGMSRLFALAPVTGANRTVALIVMAFEGCEWFPMKYSPNTPQPSPANPPALDIPRP
jgi:hypothetical protein